MFLINLFELLSAESEVKLSEKEAVRLTLKEFGMSSQELSAFFSEWQNKWAGNSSALQELVDKQMFYCLISAIFSDHKLSASIREACMELGVELGLNADRVMSAFDCADHARKITSLFQRAEFIEKHLRSEEPKLQSKSDKITKADEKTNADKGRLNLENSGSKGQKTGIKTGRRRDGNPENSGIFIANQVTPEGLDELQRLILAYELGLHVALDGAPGVGKTQSIIEVSRILELQLFTKTCSGRTTESHIIAFPVLASEGGSSVTRYEHGPLCRALEEGGVFYGDEFNLLKADVQKRLNSAFDERRMIDRADGVVIGASPNFWAAISYNPSNSMVSRDLEDSVADRFIHMHFRRWPSDLKACVAVARAHNMARNKVVSDNKFNLNLSWRGIGENNRFFKAVDQKGKLLWHDFFTGEAVNVTPAYQYLTLARAGGAQHGDTEDASTKLKALAEKAFSEIEFARVLSCFTDTLGELTRTGKSPFLKKVGLGNLTEQEDMELLSLHESSARIEIAALKHYHRLIQQGFNPYLAQSYATSLVVDQVCYGQYRDAKLRNRTSLQLVWAMAKAFQLVGDNKTYNTKMVKEALLS